MRTLPKRFFEPLTHIPVVNKWLAGHKQRVEEKIQKVRESKWSKRLYFEADGVVLTILFSITVSVASLFLGAESGGVWHWPTIATWCWSAAGLVIAGVIIAPIVAKKLMDAKEKMVRPEIELVELKGNPLVARAELILRALKDYSFHLDRYRELKSQMEEEIVEQDGAVGERYFAFLERARDVLNAAVQNFLNVVERVRRDEEYRAKDPERAAAGDGAALTLLLDELKVSVPKPELPGALIDPVRALEHEETLEGLTRELEDKVFVGG